MYNVYVLPKLNVDIAEKSPVSFNIRLIIECIEKVSAKIGNLVYVAGNSAPAGWTTSPRDKLFLAVGGDGTMLSAIKLAAQLGGVAHGINLGQVGFLTDFARRGVDRDVFEERLERLFLGQDQWIEQRMIVEAKGILAVNEVSFSHTRSDSMIKYQLLVDGSDAGIHKANSLLVSTSTGSTAYALAAGGALMMPDLKAMQIVPVAPAKLTSRPIIVSHRAEVEVHVWGSDLSIRFDGQELPAAAPSANEPLRVVVRANKSVQLVHFNDWDFFDVLSAKLGWMRA